MPLEPINRLGHAIGQAATAIYRITPVKRTIEKGLAFIQGIAHGDSDDAANREILQEADLHDFSHFGFECFPVMSDGVTEYIVVDADGGLAAIASRRALPSTLAALVAREARLYGEDGQSVLMKTGGDVEIAAKAGQKNKLGNGDISAATLRPVGYSHNTEAGASQVAVATNLKAYMAKIDVDLAAIKADMTSIDALLIAAGTLVANVVAINAWIAAHLPAGGVGPVLGPPGVKVATTLVPTTAALAADSDHSYVSSGSGTSEVEP